MIKQVFFNSSLPRAGSTLFQNLIAQNPDFYTTPTSGFLSLIEGARSVYGNSPEFKAQDSKSMERAFINFCNASLRGYFNALTDKPFVLDKNRGYSINYNFVNMWYANPKMVCLVRDLRAVFASMEKNFRKNPHKANLIQDPQQLIGTTLDKRIDIYAGGVPVGITVDRLKDVIQQGIAKKILFIRYEDLMANPEQQLRRYYEFIGLPYFEGHDFVNVTQFTQENDEFHGIYGDHKLRPKFQKLPDDFLEVLGYENCIKIKNHYKWFFDMFGYV